MKGTFGTKNCGRHTRNLVKNCTHYLRQGFHKFFFKILGATLLTCHKFRAEGPQIFGAVLKIYSFGRPDSLNLYNPPLRYTD